MFVDEIFRKDDLFYGLLEKSGVASVLKEERPFTIFKPHQDVLDCFNAIEKEYMVGPFGIDDLTFFVQYMVMEDAMYAADISQKNASCKFGNWAIDFRLGFNTCFYR